jgi:ubiquinone/menaquinone biosynthesis C-methylase UbiE
MNQNYANFLLQKTKEDYNKIAKDFSIKRARLTPDLLFLANQVKEGEKILDLGCGNGRFFELLKNKKVEYFGVDISEDLLKIAKKRYSQAKFYLFDGLSLPFEDNFFDKVFCLATFHHLPSKKYRILFLKEIWRVLKPQGKLYLTVWYLWSKRRALYLLLKYTILKLLGRVSLDFKDIFLPWKDSRGKILARRYFHMFSKGELKSLTQKAGFEVLKISFLKRGKSEKNIYLLGRKLAENSSSRRLKK